MKTKERILHTAADMFLTLGFKSVTMDDIASSISVSKKTIYQHFKTKTKLIEATTEYVFNSISTGIDAICVRNLNPIEEIFEIKQFVMKHLKNEKTSPQYQLQKHYPTIYNKLKQKQYEVTKSCVVRNLQNGINSGLYRSSIDIEFISRLYFNGLLAIKDNDLFPLINFSTSTLMQQYLEYHLRGICTKKGRQHLNNLLKNNTND